MEKSTKKIAQYSALALAASAVLPMACKKSSTDEGDPNITVTTLNLTLQSSPLSDTTKNFDINSDGVNDFYLEIYAYSPVYATRIEKLGTNQVLKYYISGNNFVRDIPSGQTIADSSQIWGNFGRGSLIDVGVNDGFAGDGDIISGVRFKIGADTHYGWIKFNVDAASKKITLKQVAYDKRANTPIKAGAN